MLIKTEVLTPSVLLVYFIYKKKLKKKYRAKRPPLFGCFGKEQNSQSNLVKRVTTCLKTKQQPFIKRKRLSIYPRVSEDESGCLSLRSVGSREAAELPCDSSATPLLIVLFLCYLT